MKKYLVLAFGILICSNNIECKIKKVNKASEFLKGALALTAAAGLAYLAYEAPVGKIQEQLTKLKNAVIPSGNLQQLNDWLSNNTEKAFNFIGTSTPWNKIDKSKLFSFITIIPAYELTKIALDKLGNSVRSHKKVSSDKKN